MLALRSFSTLRTFNGAFVRCALLSLALLPTTPFSGQTPAAAPAIGIPNDWSHHHLVFSQPGSLADSLRLQSNPRYWHQWYRRNAATSVPPGVSVGFPSIPLRQPIHKDWSVDMGSGATVGAGNYPAKYSFYTANASCSGDFAVFNTSLAGTTTQATIIAYTNLYSGCGANVPSVYWQYNTAYPQGSGAGDGSKIVTSVVLSYFGDQVAFVQSNSSTVASLVILRWKGSSSLVNLDTSTSNVAPGSYWNCSAPCMTRITFNGSHNDTNSSPFYDYANDVLYVGDDTGVLHKFQHVFKSTSSNTPGEAASGWPVTISANKLTSPVFDGGTSQRVFVADSGGFLYSVTTAGASKNTSTQVAKTGSKGIVDAPLVDSSAQTVYVVVGQDTEGTTNPCGNSTTGCNGVYQFPTAFTSSSALVESVMGVGNPATVLYDGAFDNKYYSSGPSSGTMYVCGATVTPVPKLESIAISTFGSITSVDDVKPLTSAAATCSPVTEIYNSGTDLIFLSVTASGSQTACTGACVYNFNVTTSIPSTATAGLAATGGTSGIIIDNTVGSTTLAGASQIYYSTLSNQTGCTGGTGGCAVQASQAALK